MGRPAWNAGRKLGAKRAPTPQQVWAIRFWLDRVIDSKLRGCDIVKLKIGDRVSGGRVRSRAISAIPRSRVRSGPSAAVSRRVKTTAWLSLVAGVGRIFRRPMPR